MFLTHFLTHYCLNNSTLWEVEGEGLQFQVDTRGVKINPLVVDTKDEIVSFTDEDDDLTGVDVTAHNVEDEEEVTPVLAALARIVLYQSWYFWVGADLGSWS